MANDLTPEPSHGAGDYIDEPQDLYTARIAAHSLIEKLWSFLDIVRRLLSLEDAFLKSVDAAEIEEPAELMHCAFSELVTAYNAFAAGFTPIEVELAELHDGTEPVSGHVCRSVHEALDSFASHVIESTLSGMTAPGAGEDTSQINLGNWLAVLNTLAQDVQQYDVERPVHSWIEQESENAWNRRLLASCPDEPDTDGAVGASPKKLLTSWREILVAVELNADDSSREKVKSLNQSYNGPIPKVARGGQPIVDRDELVNWWNRLAIAQQDLANQRSGARASTEGYDYGRAEKVLPEIGGSVKRRRKSQ